MTINKCKVITLDELTDKIAVVREMYRSGSISRGSYIELCNEYIRKHYEDKKNKGDEP